MVKSDKGVVSFNGEVAELLADILVLLHGVRTTMAEDIGEDEAKQLIIDTVNDSLKSEEQLIEENGGNEDGKSVIGNK